MDAEQPRGYDLRRGTEPMQSLPRFAISHDMTGAVCASTNYPCYPTENSSLPFSSFCFLAPQFVISVRNTAAKERNSSIIYLCTVLLRSILVNLAR